MGQTGCSPINGSGFASSWADYKDRTLLHEGAGSQWKGIALWAHLRKRSRSLYEHYVRTSVHVAEKIHESEPICYW
jgi:hypothetical protein